MNIYVSTITDTSTPQLKVFSSLPPRPVENLSSCSRIAASDDKTIMNLNVAGLEAALAKTRQFCKELTCDVKKSAEEFNSDLEIDQLLSLANSIVTDLQGKDCGDDQLYFSVGENIIKSLH